MDKNDYDDEPVYYCTQCLSLNIRSVPEMPGHYYCGECGASDETGETDIDTWKEMYRKMHGRDFVVKKERKWPYWYDTDYDV